MLKVARAGEEVCAIQEAVGRGGQRSQGHAVLRRRSHHRLRRTAGAYQPHGSTNDPPPFLCRSIPSRADSNLLQAKIYEEQLLWRKQLKVRYPTAAQSHQEDTASEPPSTGSALRSLTC
eukprot:766753-Hanusia_phi.AAC.3